MTNQKDQSSPKSDTPLVTMPTSIKEELLEGVPNLLTDAPHIHTRCSKCGRTDSTYRFSAGEVGELLEVEVCLHCGNEKGAAPMIPQR